MGIRPLDFTELCTNYPRPHHYSSSSSSYESESESDVSSCCNDVIPPYQAPVLRDYSDDDDDDDSSVFYRDNRRYRSSSTISSHFRDSFRSLTSLSTTISDEESGDEEPLYENRSTKSDPHTYQNIRDFREPETSNTYENVKLHSRHSVSHYENLNTLKPISRPRSRPSSLSIDYQTPRPVSISDNPPRQLVRHRNRQTPGVTSLSYCDLRASVPPQTSKKSRPEFSSGYLTPGFDPCARREPLFPPPSYSESLENLRHMKESLRNVGQGISRSTSAQSFQDLRRAGSQLPQRGIQRSCSQNFQHNPLTQSRPPLRHSISQNFHLGNPRSSEFSESLQQLSRLLDEKFLSEKLPGSEESLCRLRYPSNTTSNRNSGTGSHAASLANDSAGVESIGNESFVSSSRSCKPWEAETVSLDR